MTKREPCGVCALRLECFEQEFEAYAVAVEVADLYLDYAGVSDVVWPLPQPKWAVASPAAAITSMASSAPSSVWAQQAARLMAVAVRLAPGSFYAQCLLGRALLKSGIQALAETTARTRLTKTLTHICNAGRERERERQ